MPSGCWLGRVAHAFSLALWCSGVRIAKFKASLGYITVLKAAWVVE